MYEKLLIETEKFLEEQKMKELPIIELWEGVAGRAEREKFEMPENIGDFECLLEADKRFVFISHKLAEEVDVIDVGEEEGEYEVSEDYFEVEELEKLGFNQSQIVGLKKYEKKKDTDDDDLPAGQAGISVKHRAGGKATPALKKSVKGKKKTTAKKSSSAGRKKNRVTKKKKK